MGDRGVCRDGGKGVVREKENPVLQEAALSAFVRGRARKIVELERAYGSIKRSQPEFIIYSVPAEANGLNDWNGRLAALKT